jgi:hypothetical protein
MAAQGRGRPRKTDDAAPKKQLTLAQRAAKSKKRAGQRVAMKKRLVEVALAQHRVDALEHVAGVTACANADALAAQAVLLVNRQALTNATAALANASSSALTGKKPPLSGQAQPPTRFSASRDTSLEVGESFLEVHAGSNIDPNASQAPGSSGASQRKPPKRVSPPMATACYLFGETTGTPPSPIRSGETTEKRKERKCRDKKEVVDGYVDIQTKRLTIKEMNARAKAKEADNKQKELEIALLSEEAKIMATPITKDMDLIVHSWLEKKKKMIHDRHM